MSLCFVRFCSFLPTRDPAESLLSSTDSRTLVNLTTLSSLNTLNTVAYYRLKDVRSVNKVAIAAKSKPVSKRGRLVNFINSSVNVIRHKTVTMSQSKSDRSASILRSYEISEAADSTLFKVWNDSLCNQPRKVCVRH